MSKRGTNFIRMICMLLRQRNIEEMHLSIIKMYSAHPKNDEEYLYEQKGSIRSLIASKLRRVFRGLF